MITFDKQAPAVTPQGDSSALAEYDFHHKTIQIYQASHARSLRASDPETPVVEPDVTPDTKPNTIPVETPDEAPEEIPGLVPAPDADPVPDQCPIK
jgi:hypothetical protein